MSGATRRTILHLFFKAAEAVMRELAKMFDRK
ncbi:hypothetical protein UCCLBBS124_0064 [Levilactobacillus brevis]|nr:hypothetical protein UCCLBBS124_0064 [Levilactobacillus brevis]